MNDMKVLKAQEKELATWGFKFQDDRYCYCNNIEEVEFQWSVVYQQGAYLQDGELHLIFCWNDLETIVNYLLD